MGAHKGHPGAPTDRGRRNTAKQNAGATPGGTRASAADKEEGSSGAGEATRTAGTGNQNVGDGRACAWGAATTQGMAWAASPVATRCQLNRHQVGGVSCSPDGLFPQQEGGAHQGQTRAHTPHQHQQPTQGRPGPPMVPSPQRDPVYRCTAIAHNKSIGRRGDLLTPQGGRPGDRTPSGPAGPLRSCVKW